MIEKSAYDALKAEVERIVSEANIRGAAERKYIKLFHDARDERDQWKAQAEKLAEALEYHAEWGCAALPLERRNDLAGYRFAVDSVTKIASEALAEFAKFKEGMK